MAEDINLREVTPEAIVDEPTLEEVEAAHKNEPYYHGLWSGKPNYACPFCPHKSLGGVASIEAHIYDYHPDETGMDFGESIGDTDG